jgi:hypothetical protein
LYGPPGAGKTFTAAHIAIGLHKYAKCKKPVAMFDTEPAWFFIEPYFIEAGIEFFVYDKSRALADLLKWMDEAEKNCSIMIIDSITHIWKDCVDSFLAKLNEKRKKTGRPPVFNPTLEHWRIIKDAFGKFTEKFLTNKAHVLLCGRAGDEYDYQKNDETYKLDLVSKGKKMAAEKNLGHEPSLLLELFTEKEKGEVINKCTVMKDRSHRLNGKTFAKPTFETFKPHFDFLNLGGEHFESLTQRDSKELYNDVSEEGSYANESKQRDIWCEEIQGLLLEKFPSRSTEDNRAKQEWIEKIFNTKSWTKVQSLNSEVIKAGYLKMKETLNNKPEPVSDIDKSWEGIEIKQ